MISFFKDVTFDLGVCEYKWADYKKLECHTDSGLLKLSNSFLPTCDPSFGGDVVYLRNNTCTPLRVAASIYGVKAIWDDADCVIPEDEKYDLV